MKLSDIANSVDGLRYLTDSLEFSSAASRGYAAGREMMRSAAEVEAYRRRYDTVAASDTVRLAALLGGLKNIGNTLRRLDDGAVLDDVELFEIKQSAFLAREVDKLLASSEIRLPDLGRVIETLDPDHTGVVSFYVYDSYDARLAELRRRYSSEPTAEQMAEILAAEERVRAAVSSLLQPQAAALRSAMEQLFEIDFMLAVGRQCLAEGFAMPRLGEKTELKKLINPAVRAANGGRFQPVDIALSARPTVLVGANMGGKTVTLRSLATAQTALQFGFGVAASATSTMELFDEICFVADSSEAGLSSFGAEIKAVDRVIRGVKSGKMVLALVDEPARATNPVEGRALVEALIEVCRSECSRVLVATHYNIENADCLRLQVRGLHEGQMNYELIETTSSRVPDEALAVAEMLGADSEWIDKAKQRVANGTEK